MEDLLRNDFTVHYGLPVCTETDLVIITDDPYFEIEDSLSREIVIHSNAGMGIARFSNPARLCMSIANYDKFITGLPNSFQRDRKRCDILVTCNTDRYFILGEIKDSPNVKDHRKNAKKQLFDSLTTLKAVPQILETISSKTVKRCCYFNKQANSINLINAVSAFNRLSGVFPDGFKMTHPGIEGENFEFWEYLGVQTITLTR